MPDNTENPDLIRAANLMANSLIATKAGMEALVANLAKTLEAVKALDIDLSPLPDIPDVTVESVTHNTATVSWGEFADATGWEVSWATGDDEWVLELQDEQVRAFTFTSVKPSTTYLVTVLALNVAGEAIASGSTDVTTLKAPVGLLDVSLVTQTQSTVKIAWPAVTGAQTYTVERDGTDRTGYGTWSGSTGGTSWVFEQLKASTEYNLKVYALKDEDTVLTAGTLRVTTMPEPEPPKGEPTSGRALARVGRSGTGTNVILFRSGVDRLDQLTAWENQYGVKLDGLMRFAFRDTETKFLSDQFWRECGEIAATGRVMVIALPWAPESEGRQMNLKCAQGGYRAFHGKIIALMKKHGLNRPNVVLRWAWEYNGNWYAWSTIYGGLEAFQRAWDVTWQTFQDGGITEPRWAQCANKGPQANNRHTGADVFRPGKVDIVGLDHYNFWPAQNDQAGWNSAISQVPGLKSQTELARKHGIQWSLDENGPANGSGGQYGGDGIGYARSMVQFIRENKSDNAFVTIYDDRGAPASLNHAFNSNPNWRNAVVGALKSGW